MKRYFSKPATEMSIGDSLVFSLIITVVSMVLMVLVLVITALMEGQLDIPDIKGKLKEAKNKFTEKLKREYIDLEKEQ